MKSFYVTRVFFPWMNGVLKNPKIGELRGQLLTHAKGKTLEIGFGTGLNLPHYPANVESIVAIDPFQGAIPNVSGIPSFEFHRMEAEDLQFPDSTFDSVVTTFTLCSVNDIDLVLREILRVLKPDGRLLFLEHGKSWNQPFNVLQNLTNPFFNILAAHCNVNRDIKSHITRNGFCLSQIQQIRFQCQLISGFYYLGVATKTNKIMENTNPYEN